jgi:hypothetical protein
MAEVREYAAMLRQSADTVAHKMGVYFPGSSKETRVLIRVIVGVFAELIKVLVDKGLVTDEEIATRLSASPAEEYVEEPVVPDAVTPPPPEPEPEEPAPEEPAPEDPV